MNDLMRPALYEAWHDIVPVDATQRGDNRVYDVVGPVCESGDFLGRARHWHRRRATCWPSCRPAPTAWR
jgi:diaminopimelate decarboxylase